MAIPIGPFVAYVNEVREFSWGNVADIAHSQVKKNDAGEWETVGRDYFSIVLPAGVNVSKGDKIEVTGKFKTREYEKKDGTKGRSLEIRVETLKPVQGRQSGANAMASFGAVEIEDAPF